MKSHEITSKPIFKAKADCQSSVVDLVATVTVRDDTARVVHEDHLACLYSHSNWSMLQGLLQLHWIVWCHIYVVSNFVLLTLFLVLTSIF